MKGLWYSIAGAVIIAVLGFTAHAANVWRVADNDARYVSQSSAQIAELNRLEERIAKLKWELSLDPTNGYLRAQLEQAERNLRRTKGK